MTNWSKVVHRHTVAILVAALAILPLPAPVMAAMHSDMLADHPHALMVKHVAPNSDQAPCSDHKPCQGKCCIVCAPAAAAVNNVTVSRFVPMTVSQIAASPAFTSIILSPPSRPPQAI